MNKQQSITRTILRTEESIVPPIIRTSIAIVMFPHGAQLLLGWFGGPGFNGSMSYFTENVGLPWMIAFAVILIQFLGSLLLLFGLFTRPSALAMLVITIGMIFSGHLQHGFFMNWMGNQQGEGFEFHLLLLGLCLALLIAGGGRYSIDKTIRF